VCLVASVACFGGGAHLKAVGASLGVVRKQRKDDDEGEGRAEERQEAPLHVELDIVHDELARRVVPFGGVLMGMTGTTRERSSNQVTRKAPKL